MCGQKVSWWTERKQKLSKLLLSITPPATLGLKMSQTFWRNAGLCPAAERESTRRGRLLSFPILSTPDYSNMAVNFTKESTSQSSQRNFLIRRKRSYANEENQDINKRTNRKRFAALSLAPNV